MSGLKVDIVKEANYLGMEMDKHLTFKIYVVTVKLKLNLGNGILAKLRHNNPILLRTINYALYTL